MGQSNKSVLIKKVAPKVDLKHENNDCFFCLFFFFFLLCSYYTSDPDIGNLCV